MIGLGFWAPLWNSHKGGTLRQNIGMVYIGNYLGFYIGASIGSSATLQYKYNREVVEGSPQERHWLITQACLFEAASS